MSNEQVSGASATKKPCPICGEPIMHKAKKCINCGEFVRGLPGFKGKTLWDFMNLLIVPLILAAGGFFFNMQLDARQLQIEEDRAQEEALQSYLDTMGDLLLNENLLESEYWSKEQNLARARTLTVLSNLDPARKTTVVQFLYEARLIEVGNHKVELVGADLSGANLAGFYLQDANLSGADLSGADLSGANLARAALYSVKWDGANFKDAIYCSVEDLPADLEPDKEGMIQSCAFG